MKDISQEEFEKRIIDLINGKTSHAKLVKEFETEARTLNNRIQKLSAENPELYKAYIAKFPYTPKARNDINAIELALEILKEEGTMAQIAEKYNIGVRTLSRRIVSLKNSDNPIEQEIYSLCKIVAQNHSHSVKNSSEIETRIEIVKEQIKASGGVPERIDNVQAKRKMLLEIEKQYNELCTKMSKTEAAKTMGYTTNRIYKLLNELYRIEIEQNAKKVSGQSFKQSLKVEESKLTENSKEHKSEKNIETEENMR